MATVLCRLASAPSLLLAACVTVPTGPSVMVLPGSSRSFDEFQLDDAACRNWAALRTGTTTERAATRSGVAGAAIGAALGAAAGVAIGGAVGEAGAGAAIGAGSGLLLGSASGAARGDWAQFEVQQRYDAAFVQCMYAKGHQIPAPAATTRAYAGSPPPSTAARAPRHVPPPPPGPPPSPPPR